MRPCGADLYPYGDIATLLAFPLFSNWRSKVKRGRGAGSREQGGGLEGARKPTNRERPGRAGLDTHVPLRFTASGQGLLPQLRAPCPSASSVTHSKVLWNKLFRDSKWLLYFRRRVLVLLNIDYGLSTSCHSLFWAFHLGN